MLLISGCSTSTEQDEMAAVPEEPSPICIEEVENLAKKCDNVEHLNIAELHRCHTLETTPDFFMRKCADISLSNAGALFFLLATDRANSGSLIAQSRYLVEIKDRCDNTPIKEFTIPEKKFCEESLSLNLLDLMDDIEEQLN